MDDYDIIEASMLKQYGIRLRTADLDYSEFLNLVSCLMPDTPLGQVVAIRSETDAQTIEGFTPAQKQIRDAWAQRNQKTQSEAEYLASMDALFAMF